MALASARPIPSRPAGVSAAELQQLHERTRPTVLAAGRCLPVADDLAPLLPDGGLRRGTVVDGGTLRLTFRLVAAATAAGSWAAFVGVRDPGLAAAAELGVALERVAVVRLPGGGPGRPSDRPGDRATVPTALAALLDAVELVVVGPDLGLQATDCRRLAPRLRERGAVVLAVGPGAWPEGVDLRCRVRSPGWTGLGDGHGHLRGCEAEVAVEGRGAAARPRVATVWLGGVRSEPASTGAGALGVPLALRPAEDGPGSPVLSEVG